MTILSDVVKAIDDKWYKGPTTICARAALDVVVEWHEAEIADLERRRDGMEANGGPAVTVFDSEIAIHRRTIAALTEKEEG